MPMRCLSVIGAYGTQKARQREALRATLPDGKGLVARKWASLPCASKAGSNVASTMSSRIPSDADMSVGERAVATLGEDRHRRSRLFIADAVAVASRYLRITAPPLQNSGSRRVGSMPPGTWIEP
jgi:hypothetical protein